MDEHPIDAAVEAEVERVRVLDLDGLRALWRTTFRSSPPGPFGKDLLVRFITRHIQEKSCGALDADISKLLDSLLQGREANAVAGTRLRPGTVLVREYRGERHTVTVVSGGYVWRDSTHASLSTIARAITGTSWNGPRFFGLRLSRTSNGDGQADEVGTARRNRRGDCNRARPNRVRR